MNWFLIVAAAPMPIAVLSVIIGDALQRKQQALIEKSTRTTGTVISVRRVRGRKCPDVFFPTVGYSIDGEYREKESYRSFNGFGYVVGEEVEVLLPPDEPDYFILNGKNDFIGKPSSDGRALAVMLTLASVFLTIAVAMRSCGVL